MEIIIRKEGGKVRMKLNYMAELEALGFKAENIKKYGFAFEGKKVLIGE